MPVRGKVRRARRSIQQEKETNFWILEFMKGYSLQPRI